MNFAFTGLNWANGLDHKETSARLADFYLFYFFFERKRQVWHSTVDLRVTIEIAVGVGGWWRLPRDNV